MPAFAGHACAGWVQRRCTPSRAWQSQALNYKAYHIDGQWTALVRATLWRGLGGLPRESDANYPYSPAQATGPDGFCRRFTDGLRYIHVIAPRGANPSPRRRAPPKRPYPRSGAAGTDAAAPRQGVDEHGRQQHQAGDDELGARAQAQQAHSVLHAAHHQRA